MTPNARNPVKLIKTAKVATMAVGAVLALAGAVVPAASAAEISYHQVDVDGVRIAYREAGDPRRPALLLLHGVPSSSRMYERLMRELGDRYHLVAPDYPGFGNSAAPDPAQFVYSFDHLAKVVEKFTDQVGLNRYTLFMQDYGTPVGMRLAGARPQAIQALIFQNGNVYEEGLGPVWESRKLYWQDRPALEAKVQSGGAAGAAALTASVPRRQRNNPLRRTAVPCARRSGHNSLSTTPAPRSPS